MAKIIQTDKGFKVIGLARKELIEKLGNRGALGICDSCNGTDDIGYYIPVLNRWFCRYCFYRWYNSANYYQEDSAIEERNFNAYKSIFGL